MTALLLAALAAAGILAALARRRARAEGEAWRLVHRVASEHTGEGVDTVAASAVERAGALLPVERVELVLGEAGHEQQWRWQRGRHGGRLVWTVVPLRTADACVGALWLGVRRRRGLRRRDDALLAAFASTLAATVMTTRLFEDLNRDRHRLEQVFTNSSDGIFSVDGRGQVSSWNPAMAGLTGRGSYEVLGRPVEQAMPATTEHGELITAEWMSRGVAPSGHLQVVAGTMSLSAGQRWLSLSVSPARGDRGDGVVVVARDVTASRAADQARQDFVATVSHELRTPLTPLKGFLLTLMRAGFDPTPDERAEYYARMLDQTRRLERLVEDLLSISQIDGGTFTVHAAPVGVDDVIERVTDAASRPVSVEWGGAQVVAYADAGRVEQVLHNLVGNAEKYAGPDGAISVTADVVGDEVVVSVADDGPGIAPEHQELIFERFRRLGPGAARSASGTGLGLYIARRLVEAMGGHIWVESEPGRGARFRFTLPTAGPSTADSVITLR
jgi:PAS domain S-box-containing protein